MDAGFNQGLFFQPALVLVLNNKVLSAKYHILILNQC